MLDSQLAGLRYAVKLRLLYFHLPLDEAIAVFPTSVRCYLALWSRSRQLGAVAIPRRLYSGPSPLHRLWL